VKTVPRISYARSADGVSLAFTVTGDGPALVFVPWVPFSNLQMDWQNPLLRGVFEQLAQRLTLVHYDGRGTGHSQRDVTDFGVINSLTNVAALFTASRYGVGRRMGRADRRSFLGPWRSRNSRRATQQILAGVLRIDPMMAEAERSLRTTLADLIR
jgi:pimeloyl-ACP methyl ester carboxylesterase